jgi:choline kinase
MIEGNKIIICAAGTGSRLGFNLPKCLTEIEGRPLVYWQLDLLNEFSTIIMVIGFRFQEVIDTVSARRPDVTFVHNTEYLSTNTLDSLRLGAMQVAEPFVSLDGDLLVTKSALESINAAQSPTIGIKKTYSDEPVCVKIEHQNNSDKVIGFTRQTMEYEWTGLAKIEPKHLKATSDAKYVYQALENILPINYVNIDCQEIDTLADYEEAKIWIRKNLL